MAHTRTQILIETPKQAQAFVSMLNSDGTADKYVLENFDCSYVIDARSLLGVIYAYSEFEGPTYLVNATNDGVYPTDVYKFFC